METRIEGDSESREVFINGEWLDPAQSLKIYNHSPVGFNWSYGGSGPAQLALAILLKFLPIEQAVKYHQQFKWKYIATLPQGNFDITLNMGQIIKELDENISVNKI